MHYDMEGAPPGMDHVRVGARVASQETGASAGERVQDVLGPPKPMPMPVTIWACVSAMASTSSVWCTSRPVDVSLGRAGAASTSTVLGAAVWQRWGEHPRAG